MKTKLKKEKKFGDKILNILDERHNKVIKTEEKFKRKVRPEREKEFMNFIIKNYKPEIIKNDIERYNKGEEKISIRQMVNRLGIICNGTEI